MNSKLQATLDYYLVKLATEQLSNSTKRSYASVARQFFYFIEDNGSLNGELAVGSFGTLARYFLSSERDGKSSSLTSRASAIKYFLRASGLPVDTFERPQTALTTREPLTQCELDAFMRAAHSFQPRDRAIGMLFATTGIRLLECAALNLENLDTIGESGTLVLALARSHCGRLQIPLNAETQAAFEEYLEERHGQAIESADTVNHPLFVDKNGGRLSARALTASVRKIGWSTGLGVTPATLRVTRLIQIARRGSDAVTLAHLGGFDSLEAARRIIRACKNDLTRASVEAEMDSLLRAESETKVARDLYSTNSNKTGGPQQLFFADWTPNKVPSNVPAGT